MLNKSDLMKEYQPSKPSFGPDPSSDDITLFDFVDDQKMFAKMYA
jgi:hypothetical protein